MTDQPASAADIYDAFASEYRSYSEGKSAYIAAVDGLIVSQAPAAPGVVLDYGSGDGVRGAAVAKQLNAGSLHQVDISPEMVALCRELGAAEQVLLADGPGWTDELPPIDVAMCLWNVMGHVPTPETRAQVLQQIFKVLKPGGLLFLDVNNRHNIGYGKWRAWGRRILDAMWPDTRRGDVAFNWEINGKVFPATGHFFTRSEVENLAGQAGFEVRACQGVDYSTGKVSDNTMQGQLFFVFAKPETG